MRLILIWLLNACALLAVAYLMPSIKVASFGSALIAALLLGLVNTALRPLLVLLTLPVTLLTLGLFLFVLNGPDVLARWFDARGLRRRGLLVWRLWRHPLQHFLVDPVFGPARQGQVEIAGTETVIS
jgi:putative membrane protein